MISPNTTIVCTPAYCVARFEAVKEIQVDLVLLYYCATISRENQVIYARVVPSYARREMATASLETILARLLVPDNSVIQQVLIRIY